MKCKHCSEPLEPGCTVCPGCGAEVEQDNGLRKARQRALLSGVVAAMAVLATVLFFLLRSGWQFGCSGKTAVPITQRDSYSVSDRKAWRKRDVAVATMGNDRLTNAQLQIYYWTGVYDFIGNYSYYLTALGLDLTKPLDEQYLEREDAMLEYLLGSKVSYDMTWQQYFLQNAIQLWQSNQALAQMARDNGYTMDAESRAKLDDLPRQLKIDAQKAGFSTVEAYLEHSMGPGCTVNDYYAYMEVYYLGYSYFAHLYEKIQPTDQELEAYFEENQQMLLTYGITKNMGYTVDVRHILITPDGQLPTQEGKFTEDQWLSCRVRAQQILDQFQAGEQTEARFGELAKQYSNDSQDNVEAGGLYTLVQRGEMEENFDAWCFAEERKIGDVGLVKTAYGYHVIYFVGTQELWLAQTRAVYVRQESQKIINAALDSHPIQVEYKKIVLGKVDLS